MFIILLFFSIFTLCFSSLPSFFLLFLFLSLIHHRRCSLVKDCDGYEVDLFLATRLLQMMPWISPVRRWGSQAIFLHSSDCCSRPASGGPQIHVDSEIRLRLNLRSRWRFRKRSRRRPKILQARLWSPKDALGSQAIWWRRRLLEIYG